MSQPTAGEVVDLLGVDASSLPLAPVGGLGLGRDPLPCVRCGVPGQVMLVAGTALGHRWVDLCNRCFRWATARR